VTFASKKYLKIFISLAVLKVDSMNLLASTYSEILKMEKSEKCTFEVSTPE